MTKYKFLKKILDIPSPSGDEISTKELMVNNLISTKNIADSYNISTDEIGNIYFQLYNNKIFGCDICSNIMCTCEKYLIQKYIFKIEISGDNYVG